MFVLYSMHLFQGQKNGNYFLLNDKDEVHHCIKVTRHKLNDEILLTDFEGTIYKATIEEINKDSVRLKIVAEFLTQKNNSTIHIGISLAQSSDRFEWFLEKATEIGVERVTPLLCKRTENTKNRIERWQKIILASSKQCLRPSLMNISEPIKFTEFLKTSLTQQRYICHCEDNSLPFIGKIYNPDNEVIVLIGPEGDFTTDEIEMARNNNFTEVSLGRERLRMETAGLAVSTILKTIQNIK